MKSSDFAGWWLVEWNLDGKCFEIHPVAEALQQNFVARRAGTPRNVTAEAVLARLEDATEYVRVQKREWRETRRGGDEETGRRGDTETPRSAGERAEGGGGRKADAGGEA